MNTLMGWLVTYLIHSTILLGLACLLDRLLRGRPHWQEPVWKMALVGGIVTATVQTGAGLRPWGGTLNVGVEPPRVMAATGFAEVASAARELGAPACEAAASVPASPARPAGVAFAGLAAADPAQPHPLAQPGNSGFSKWRSIALGVWAAGALILLGALARSWLLLQRRLRGRRPLHEGEISRALSALAWGPPEVDQPRLSASSKVTVPIALGILHPEICVPERVLYELSREAQESLLAHELGHLVRRDPLWRLVCSGVGRALFFQPLNWLAARRVDACAELLSDDWAAERTARPLSLAECLTAVARWTVRPMGGLPVAVAITGASDLRQRIERLVRGNLLACRAKHSRWAWPAAWSILAALTLLAPAACGGAEASGKGAAAPGQPPRNTASALQVADTEQDDDADDDDDDSDDSGEASCHPNGEPNHGKTKGERAERKHDRADRHDRDHRYSYSYSYRHGDDDGDEDDDESDGADEKDDEPAPRGRTGKQDGRGKGAGHGKGKDRFAIRVPSLDLDLNLDLNPLDLDQSALDEQLDKLQESLAKELPSNEQVKETVEKALRQARKELAQARKEMKESLAQGMKEARKARKKQMRELRERLPEIQRQAQEAAERAGEQAREQAREQGRLAREQGTRDAQRAMEEAREQQREARKHQREAQDRQREAQDRQREAQERQREAQERQHEAEIREKVREKTKKKAKAHKHAHDDNEGDDDIYDE